MTQKKTKICFKCKKRKRLTSFYKHSMMGDGHLNKCKECTKRDVREHRQNSERSREYDRERYRNNPARKAYTARVGHRWRKKHPKRARAQRLVAYAIRTGKITRQPCEACGTAKNIHAHHDDYNNPLDVRWLCARCHAAYHRKK